MRSDPTFDSAPGGQGTRHAAAPAAAPTTVSPALRHRAVLAADFDLVGARSAGSPLDLHVLQPRYGSFGDFFRSAMDEQVRRAFYLSQDDAGRVLGWACCLRFHEREGYASCAQCVVEVGGTPLEREAASEQLALCMEACKAQGVRTLVATLHGAMEGAIAWHAAQGFSDCGTVALPGGARLQVLSRRIA